MCEKEQLTWTSSLCFAWLALESCERPVEAKYSTSFLYSHPLSRDKTHVSAFSQWKHQLRAFPVKF